MSETVMVPVPEQHRTAFQTWLLQKTLRSQLNSWNPEKITRAIDRLEELDRVAVRAIAAIKGVWAEGDEVAAEVGIPTDEVLERLNAVNEACWDDDAPALVMIQTADHSRTGRPRLIVDSSIREDVFKALSS
ncbi:MAG: hypothetical protein KF906_11780 [Actinobacteria bacterium]|nr:hypothetical protein [Actinomycetota bacterium]